MSYFNATIKSLSPSGDNHHHLVLEAELNSLNTLLPLNPAHQLWLDMATEPLRLPVMGQASNRLDCLLDNNSLAQTNLTPGLVVQLSINSEHSLQLDNLHSDVVLVSEVEALAETILLSQQLRQQQHSPRLVLIGGDSPLPFRQKPSMMVVESMPDGVIACVPLLEDWKIPSRLAHEWGLPGTFEGSVTELLEHYLAQTQQGELEQSFIVLGSAQLEEVVVATLADKLGEQSLSTQPIQRVQSVRIAP